VQGASSSLTTGLKKRRHTVVFILQTVVIALQRSATFHRISYTFYTVIFNTAQNLYGHFLYGRFLYVHFLYNSNFIRVKIYTGKNLYRSKFTWRKIYTVQNLQYTVIFYTG
jgi:hypothetical protein